MEGVMFADFHTDRRYLWKKNNYIHVLSIIIVAGAL